MKSIQMKNGRTAANKKDAIKLKSIVENWLDDFHRIPADARSDLIQSLVETYFSFLEIMDSDTLGLNKLAWLYDYTATGLLDITGVQDVIVQELREILRICKKYLVITEVFPD